METHPVEIHPMETHPVETHPVETPAEVHPVETPASAADQTASSEHIPLEQQTQDMTLSQTMNAMIEHMDGEGGKEEGGERVTHVGLVICQWCRVVVFSLPTVHPYTLLVGGGGGGGVHVVVVRHRSLA